ncbi:MAG: hypothetical protein AVDCRST_MAG88-99, partial [uncultured Thermomicrobiales bacterium]
EPGSHPSPHEQGGAGEAGCQRRPGALGAGSPRLALLPAHGAAAARPAPAGAVRGKPAGDGSRPAGGDGAAKRGHRPDLTPHPLRLGLADRLDGHRADLPGSDASGRGGGGRPGYGLGPEPRRPRVPRRVLVGLRRRAGAQDASCRPQFALCPGGALPPAPDAAGPGAMAGLRAPGVSPPARSGGGERTPGPPRGDPQRRDDGEGRDDPLERCLRGERSCGACPGPTGDRRRDRAWPALGRARRP